MSDHAIAMTETIYDYLLKTSLREPTVLHELRRKTHELSAGTMQISPDQGQFMQLLIEMLSAKKTLDIGVFTGYSALCVALALPTDGIVIACDINEEWTNIAKTYWAKANVHNKIQLRLAPAIETLDELITTGQAGTFDFSFIDADKAGYPLYYEKSLTLLRQGGIIAIDNTLWSGKVADSSIKDNATNVIRSLNTRLLQDERITLSLLSIGDGLTLARKR